jgi:hypothetical protein
MGKIEELKFLFQGIIALGIISYFLGFIVVNSYLLGFGFTSFGFFKTRYVAAGLNFIFLSFISTVLALVFTSLRTQPDLSHYPQYGDLVISSVMILGVSYSYAVLSTDSQSIMNLLVSKHLIPRILVIILILVLANAMPRIVVHYIGKVKKWEKAKTRQISLFVARLSVALFFLLTLSIVSLSLVLWVAGAVLVFVLILKFRFLYPLKTLQEKASPALTKID